MLNDMRDWLSLAVGVVSLIFTLKGGLHCRRQSRRERFRSFKGFGIEWTAYDRHDDSRS
jgi:hypothetical protein